MTDSVPAETARERDFWRRHLPWQGPVEYVVWVVAFAVSAVGNTLTTLIDADRYGQPLAGWMPAVWEGSSAVVSLAMLPLLLRACERWPLHADTWRRRLPGYLVASVAWSLLHVVGMVLLRQAAYAAMGESYDFDWGRGLPYEYLKDVRTFTLIVCLAHTYRWLWRRLQGEVRLLDPPDPGIPGAAGQADRPERFLVRKLGREFLVAAADIEWLQAAGNYVNLHVAGRDYPLRSTMAGIESQLDPARFTRIHRSYIVNLSQVESIEPLESGDARIRTRAGAELPCSRRYRDALRPR